MKRVFVIILTGLVLCAFGSVERLRAADPILIGIPTSLTAIEGKEAAKVVQMAVDEINAKGGVKVGNEKRLLKIETIDLRDSSPGVPVSEALLGIEKIITEKKVNAIVVGPFRSEALIASMDIVSKYKVPLLGTIAMSPKSEDMIKQEPEKYKYIFRVAMNAPYLVGYLAKTLGVMNKEFGFNKLFVMVQDVLWARATGEGAAKRASSDFGYEVVGIEAFPTGSSDFTAALSKAKTKNAQLIMPIFDMPQSGILVKQWQSMRIPSLVFGALSPMSGPDAWKIFEGKIAGLLNTNYELGSGIAPDKYAPAKKFYDDYTKKFGQPIESHHGPGPSYDSVYILAEAIERAGTLDPDKVAAEIMKTDRQGVIGRIKFNEGHQVIYGDDPAQTACGAVSQFDTNGKRIIVFPEAIADAKIQLPEWMKQVK